MPGGVASIAHFVITGHRLTQTKSAIFCCFCVVLASNGSGYSDLNCIVYAFSACFSFPLLIVVFDSFKQG